MTLLDRLKSALQSPWLPLALLLLALSTVFVFGGDRGHFYRCCGHNWISSHHLTIAVNLSPEHGFQRFEYRFVDEDGDVRYWPYNRFPIGSHASMKLATLPFGGSSSAQITAARILMLLFFAAAAVLAYLSLCRLASNRWIALTATLLAFSSYCLLYYNDMISADGMPDFFVVMLTFHGMIIFVQEGRFRQLLVKTCIALLFGWHVLALLVPFVIFGLVREILRARKPAASSTPPPARYVKRIASTLLRSRYLLLGIVALGVGLSVFTFNFTMEYVALGGETPLTELPSFKSMLRRTGQNPHYNERHASFRSWRPFLEVQFRSVLRMFIPYQLLGFRTDEYVHNVAVDGYPTWLSRFQGVVLGIALVAACLIGSMFVRQKMLFATLASFGFFWVLPMRNNIAEVNHIYETMYYIGLPLVFFTLILLLARRLTRRDGVIAAAAVGALLLFAVSSFQMGRFVLGSEAAQAALDEEQDLLAIRELVGGEPVTVRNSRDRHGLHINVAGYFMHYYMNPIFVEREYYPSGDRGFIVMYHRVDTDSLLTPQNRYFFLYNGPDLIASYRSAYPSIVSTEPLVRGDFDVYVDDGTVHYVKEPCRREDTRSRFFLHVFPEDLDDLPDNRKQYRFANLDFRFTERGLMFDGKCMLRFNLPQYDIAGFRTGQAGANGARGWSIAHVIQGPKLVSAYPSIVSGEPMARSEFDLYIDEDKLYYVKESCSIDDVQDVFFLNIVPADLDDLPYHRKEYGFDNLDFGFDVRGVQFDGKCAASVGLPQYDIARITTGQHDRAGRIWAAEIVLDANLIASYRSAYQSMVSTEPVGRGEFDVYVDDNTVHYVKEPCRREDTQAGFSLHVFPQDINDLSEDRRGYRFDNLDFHFTDHGLLFEGRCVASVDLPEYDIAGFHTGQAGAHGARGWNIAHVVQGPKLISEYPSIVAHEPVVRSEFDLYIDEGKLYYVKESCGIEDVEDGFFLHIVPAYLDDLPDNRTEYGFDNLDFGFDVRGIVFDGKCLASIGLPQYDIARITTGQYDEDGRIWAAEAAEIVSEYPSIVSTEPAARSEFDLYLDEGKLYYVKEPCESEDVQDGFFLHIVPEDIDDLPDDRREHGFDNFDFGFDVRGVQFDGKCAASIGLPQYGIARITTGQYDGIDRIWEIELESDALE